MFVTLFHFLFNLILLFLLVHLLSFLICLYEVLLHELLYLLLPLHVLFELILDKARELLLLEDLDVSIELLHAALHLDLLHVQIEDFLVTHLIVTHEYTLAELGVEVRRVDKRKTGRLGCLRGRRCEIASLSN